METGGAVTVGETLALLEAWHPRLLAGKRGLGRRVSWAGTMRARLPAFEGFTGGELALLSLATLRLLRASVDTLTLAALVDELASLGAAAIALTDPEEGRASAPSEATALDDAQHRADALSIPLIELPPGTSLGMVEREVIQYVVEQRTRQAATIQQPTPADLRGEALEVLLTGTYASEPLMRARASQFGFDLARPHIILWADLAPSDAARDGARPARRAASDATAFGDALEMGLGAWVRVREARIVALLAIPSAAPEERGISDLIERVRELLTRTLGADDPTWTAGLGEPATSPAEVRRSMEEAHATERLGREVLGAGHIARPGDLGVYRLLLALHRTGDLAPFIERALAPLLADKRTGDALVETLGVFFACNGNLSEAARHLHLHRNSLLYRLHRARELLGHDLDDPELRLTLQLAIKGQRVLALG